MWRDGTARACYRGGMRHGPPPSSPLPAAPHGDGAVELDARGLLCPLPVLRLARALRERAGGGLVRLVADDPMAAIDVPHFCAEAGHPILAEEVAEPLPGGREARAWLIRAGSGGSSSTGRKGRG